MYKAKAIICTFSKRIGKLIIFKIDKGSSTKWDIAFFAFDKDIRYIMLLTSIRRLIIVETRKMINLFHSKGSNLKSLWYYSLILVAFDKKIG